MAWDAAQRKCVADALIALLDRPPGGVGIAAPQIGKPVAIVVIDCRRARRPCRHHGLLVMCDPVIERAEGEVWGREGCLSVPGWRGLVPRAARVVVSFFDLDGRKKRLHSEGFEARVVQHEVDHLHGILFIDRIRSTRDLVRR